MFNFVPSNLLMYLAELLTHHLSHIPVLPVKIIYTFWTGKPIGIHKTTNFFYHGKDCKKC